MPAIKRSSASDPRHAAPDDASLLERLGYGQELSRTLNAFSNFAISLSIICILAGGITSFHIGYCSVGGAAIATATGRRRLGRSLDHARDGLRKAA